MKVITGTARGHKLIELINPDVRPTSDMVKQAMFNIVQFEVEQAFVLDLFAGSGQLGIEALSRGAKYCVFVDVLRDAQEVIRQNLQHTDLAQNSRLVSMDYHGFLAASRDVFDIAFLDPPYEQGVLDKALPLLAPKMSDQGAILCESANTEILPQTAGEFELYRQYKYGKKMITVYRKPEKEDEDQ